MLVSRDRCRLRSRRSFRGEQTIAGTDCGLGTMAGRSAIVPAVAYTKLASLAEGARLASAVLW